MYPYQHGDGDRSWDRRPSLRPAGSRPVSNGRAIQPLHHAPERPPVPLKAMEKGFAGIVRCSSLKRVTCRSARGITERIGSDAHPPRANSSFPVIDQSYFWGREGTRSQESLGDPAPEAALPGTRARRRHAAGHSSTAGGSLEGR